MYKYNQTNDNDIDLVRIKLEELTKKDIKKLFDLLPKPLNPNEDEKEHVYEDDDNNLYIKYDFYYRDRDEDSIHIQKVLATKNCSKSEIVRSTIGYTLNYFLQDNKDVDDPYDVNNPYDLYIVEQDVLKIIDNNYEINLPYATKEKDEDNLISNTPTQQHSTAQSLLDDPIPSSFQASILSDTIAQQTVIISDNEFPTHGITDDPEAIASTPLDNKSTTSSQPDIKQDEQEEEYYECDGVQLVKIIFINENAHHVLSKAMTNYYNKCKIIISQPLETYRMEGVTNVIDKEDIVIFDKKKYLKEYPFYYKNNETGKIISPNHITYDIVESLNIIIGIYSNVDVYMTENDAKILTTNINGIATNPTPKCTQVSETPVKVPISIIIVTSLLFLGAACACVGNVNWKQPQVKFMEFSNNDLFLMGAIAFFALMLFVPAMMIQYNDEINAEIKNASAKQVINQQGRGSGN